MLLLLLLLLLLRGAGGPMSRLHVSRELAAVGGGVAALVALEGLLARVDPLVRVEVGGLLEGGVAHVALVRLDARVYLRQGRCGRGRAAAEGIGSRRDGPRVELRSGRSRLCVSEGGTHPLVTGEVAGVCGRIAAHVALVRLALVASLVHREVARVRARKRALGARAAAVRR